MTRSDSSAVVSRKQPPGLAAAVGVGEAWRLIPKRLPHVLTRKDLALVLAPTYAASANVDFDEALERMERAMASQRVADSLYEGIAEGLRKKRGDEDELIDELSRGVQNRRSRVKSAPLSPAVSAAMVMLNLELGYAPEMMRNALAEPKGQALLKQGLAELGAHLVKELVK